MNHVTTSDHEDQANQFYSGAQARIVRIMIAIALLFTIAIWIRAGYRLGLGFAVGCGIAGLNFYWLARAVNAFADRVTGVDAGQKADQVAAPSGGSAGRFILRFSVVALVAYVIFKSSPVSLSGLMAGLFLPVAAIFVEATYETFVALRRGL
jgi:ATP synthase I subunit